MTTETLTVYVAKRHNTQWNLDWLDVNTVAATFQDAHDKAEEAKETNPYWAEKHPVVEIIRCKLCPSSPTATYLEDKI